MNLVLPDAREVAARALRARSAARKCDPGRSSTDSDLSSPTHAPPGAARPCPCVRTQPRLAKSHSKQVGGIAHANVGIGMCSDGRPGCRYGSGLRSGRLADRGDLLGGRRAARTKAADPFAQARAHIEALRKEGIADKTEKAANKKYKMTIADSDQGRSAQQGQCRLPGEVRAAVGAGFRTAREPGCRPVIAAHRITPSTTALTAS